MSGQGRVVLTAPGPVEEVTLDGERLVVEGKLVIARTQGLDDRVRRATKFFQSFISGESAVRTYQGKGKALVCWTPYWNQYMMNAIAR
ncbi:MAG: AIM24 family protein [Geminicoccaceae bacterium]